MSEPQHHYDDDCSLSPDFSAMLERMEERAHAELVAFLERRSFMLRQMLSGKPVIWSEQPLNWDVVSE